MRKIIIIFILFIFYHKSVLCNQDSIRINGKVRWIFDSTEVFYAEVSILDKDNNRIKYFNTDNSGEFDLFIPQFDFFKLSIHVPALGKKDTIVKNEKSNEILFHDIYIGRIIPSNELRYNSIMAKKDLANGKIQLLNYGLSNLSEKKLKRLTQKYGFTEKNLGCNIDENLIQSIESYNKIVYQYLDNRNGKEWKKKYEDEIKAAIKNVK